MVVYPCFVGICTVDTVLTPDEIIRLEALADATGIDTRGDREHTME